MLSACAVRKNRQAVAGFNSMFNVRFFSRRKNRQPCDAREQRHRLFILLAIFLGLLLAIGFGWVLYTINVAGRI